MLIWCNLAISGSTLLTSPHLTFPCTHGLSVSIQHPPLFIAYEATLWKYFYTDDLQINVSFSRPPDMKMELVLHHSYPIFYSRSLSSKP
jgi:hypothetical protein